MGEGNDFLIAGSGVFSRTTMTGGAGADSFVLGLSASGYNTINDFSAAQGDRVLLDFDYAAGSDPIGAGLFRLVNTSLGASIQFDTTGTGTFVQLAFAVGATLSTADLFWPAIVSIEDAVGLVIENKTNTVSGALAGAVDVDGDGALTIRGRYGVVQIDASGNWSYVLDCTNSTVCALGSRSAALTDTIRVTLANGQRQDIVVSIEGTDADRTLSAGATGLDAHRRGRTIPINSGKLRQHPDRRQCGRGHRHFVGDAFAGRLRQYREPDAARQRQDQCHWQRSRQYHHGQRRGKYPQRWERATIR